MSATVHLPDGGVWFGRSLFGGGVTEMPNGAHLISSVHAAVSRTKPKAMSGLESCPAICFESRHTSGIARNLFQGSAEEMRQIIV